MQNAAKKSIITPMSIFKKSQLAITISTETIIKAIGLTFIFFLLLQFISKAMHPLTLIAVSAFLALALNPAVTWLTLKLKSKSRVRATGFAYVIVLAVLTGFLLLVVPSLVSQTSDFINDLPDTVDSFLAKDTAISRGVERFHLDDQINKIGSDLSNRNGNLGGTVFSTAGRVGGTIVSVITVLVLTFMMLVEGPIWLKRLMDLQPYDKRAKRRNVLQRLYKVVTGYVNGQVLIATIAACFAFVGLLIGNAIFDASVNAVAMAGIIFIFGLIPMFGNILGASIVVIFSLFSSGSLAIAMALFFIVYQQIENASLQPYIQSRSNQLTPLTVFIAALLGVGVGGILGALAAIPIAGCLRILLEEYMDKRLPIKETPE